MEALPPVLKNAVDKAVQQSDTAHQSFLQNLPKVKQSVSAARGSAPSSESWVVAQVQLSVTGNEPQPFGIGTGGYRFALHEALGSRIFRSRKGQRPY